MTDGKKKQSKRSTNWVFTLNNPRVDAPTLLGRLEVHKNRKYAIFQKEKGSNGTPHYQGYLELHQPRAISAIKKMVGLRAHVEIRKGNANQAREYCRKPESRLAGPFECGTFVAPRPGTRTDIHDAVETLARTRSLRDVALAHSSTFIRYHKGFSRYLSVTGTDRTEPPKVCLYFGGTGTGKTRKAIEENPGYFRKHPDTKWFDGYTGQTSLILDDFSGASSKMSLNYVLQLIDRYPIEVEVKGGYEKLLAKKIIITTNNHPNSWYDYSSRNEQYTALARRFTEVWVFDKVGAFRVQKKKFFGDSPFTTVDDYRTIAEKRPVLHHQNATVRAPKKNKLVDLTTLSETEQNSSLFDSEESLIDSIDLVAMSEDDSSDESSDFEPKKKRRRKG